MWLRVTLGLILIAAVALAVGLFAAFPLFSVEVSLPEGVGAPMSGPATTGVIYAYLVFLMSCVISAVVFLIWLVWRLGRLLHGVIHPTPRR